LLASPSPQDRHTHTSNPAPPLQLRLPSNCSLFCAQDHIEASKELRKSETFKLLLSITLGLGNFVNSGSRQGNAGGFRLKTLNKLHDSKTPDSKLTMLQVRFCVCGVCVGGSPSLFHV
jgi:hypothetical protein